MHKYEHVEDYIEVIAGLRDPNTLKPAGLGWFSPIINLARYDIPVLNSMSEHTYNGGALTEKQSNLAVQLILKYRRQLTVHGIDSDISKSIKFRKPFRLIDGRKDLYIDGHRIKIRFPYDKLMIEEIRAFAEKSQGRCHWEKENKVWSAELTEYNLNWLFAWGKKYQFSIDTQASELMSNILEVEKTGFSISLLMQDDKFVIQNACESLIQYITESAGGMTKDNLIRLVDLSPILGYTVDDALQFEIKKKFNKDICRLLFGREIVIDQDAPCISMSLIKTYSLLVKRFPIVIYEPDLTNRWLDRARECFSDNEIQLIGCKPTKNMTLDPLAKVVHTIKPLPSFDIPLLISSAGLVAGGERQLMMQRSEKVVYSSSLVYNSKKQFNAKQTY